jgi:hypothetical protein
MAQVQFMNDDAVRVNRIQLWAAFPSLRLLQAVRLGLSLQCLLPAVATVLLFHAALSTPSRESTASINPYLLKTLLPAPVVMIAAETREIFVGGFKVALLPDGRLPSAIHVLLSLMLLATGGVAITRAAGGEFCRSQRTGAIRSMRFAIRSWKAISIATAVLFLSQGLAFLVFRLSLKILSVLPDMLTGVLMFGLLIQAILTMLFFGVCGIGWLLAAGAIGIDGCDGLEALSRGISYVLSRFWRTLGSVAVILVLAGFSLFIVQILIDQAGTIVTQALAASGLSMSAGRSAFLQLQWVLMESCKTSVFFSGLGSLYVLLRHFEDNVALDEMNQRQA